MIEASFSSGLAAVLQRYVGMKRALGRQFNSATHALLSLDRLLAKDGYADPNATAFHAWCRAQEHLASGVRRVRMLEAHAFCLYRRRTEPDYFLPDPQAFPPYHQRLRPYIFTESEIARLLNAASGMKGNPSTPLRPELTRLAIVLLFTTGMRRWRTPESGRGRLQPPGENVAYSADEVLENRQNPQDVARALACFM
jgi:integrase